MGSCVSKVGVAGLREGWGGGPFWGMGRGLKRSSSRSDSMSSITPVPSSLPMGSWKLALSLPLPLSFLALCALGRYSFLAGHLVSLQWWSVPWQFRHLRCLQSQTPTTACLRGHFWLCSSDLWAPPHLKHLTEFVP